MQKRGISLKEDGDGEMSKRPSTAASRRASLLAAWLAAALAAGACEGDPPARPHDPARALFVDVYVDLRLAALRSSDGVVPVGERERILAEHGASSDAMLAFVAANGEDLVFMRELWTEIWDRISEAEIDAHAR